MAATGDIKGNIERLRDELRRSRYEGAALDVPALTAGEAAGFLPLLHFALLHSSRALAAWVAASGYELSAKTDLRFIEAVYRLVRDELGYRHKLTCKQMLGPGFAERKVLFIIDVLQLCRTKHADLTRERASRTKSNASYQTAAADALATPRKVPACLERTNCVSTSASTAEHPRSAPSPRMAARRPGTAPGATPARAKVRVGATPIPPSEAISPRMASVLVDQYAVHRAEATAGEAAAIEAEAAALEAAGLEEDEELAAIPSVVAVPISVPRPAPHPISDAAMPPVRAAIQVHARASSVGVVKEDGVSSRGQWLPAVDMQRVAVPLGGEGAALAAATSADATSADATLADASLAKVRLTVPIYQAEIAQDELAGEVELHAPLAGLDAEMDDEDGIVTITHDESGAESGAEDSSLEPLDEPPSCFLTQLVEEGVPAAEGAAEASGSFFLTQPEVLELPTARGRRSAPDAARASYAKPVAPLDAPTSPPAAPPPLAPLAPLAPALADGAELADPRIAPLIVTVVAKVQSLAVRTHDFATRLALIETRMTSLEAVTPARSLPPPAADKAAKLAIAEPTSGAAPWVTATLGPAAGGEAAAAALTGAELPVASGLDAATMLPGRLAPLASSSWRQPGTSVATDDGACATAAKTITPDPAIIRALATFQSTQAFIEETERRFSDTEQRASDVHQALARRFTETQAALSAAAAETDDSPRAVESA